MDLKEAIEDINRKWEMRFNMLGDDLVEEIFSKISNYDEIFLSAALYKIEVNKFGFQVYLDTAMDSTVSLEQIQEVGKEEFDNENYHLESVVNAYVAKISDWSDDSMGVSDDIIEAILKGGGSLSYCEKRLLLNGEVVWKSAA